MPQRRLPRMPQPRDAYMPFKGGLDQETPAWEVPHGFLRESQNYEIGVKGGYVDVEGYERFDGRPAPSAATYATLNVTITGSLEANDTITGATSAATAVVVLVDTSDDQAFVVITKISGTFAASEDLEVSSSVEANTDAAAVVDGATTPKLHAQYLNLAADAYRSDITAVPGEGAVLGVSMLNDVWYAFRNATGGATAKMYKSTTSGWTEVALGLELAFTSGGTTAIAEGDTITGATSGATAEITRVVLESGSWAGGDAAGRFIIAAKTGTFESENVNVGASTNLATIAADFAAITLQPGGDYEFYRSEFADPADAERLYGCDGVNRGFEFDGTVFVPIATGMTADTPTHVIVHRQHLIFSFRNQVQTSGIGAPYSWTLLTGASALRTDGIVTGFKREPGADGGAALTICNTNRLHILYGTSSANWNLIPFRDEVGAFANTIQDVGFTIMLDQQGITSFRTAQEFGNFATSTLSTGIQTFINGKLALASASCIVRKKNQYRLFFSDGTGLHVTMNGNKIAGMMPVQYVDEVRQVFSLEANDGSEVVGFGSDNGFVYRMDSGTSFDGEPINAFLITHFTKDALRYVKGFMHSATIEARGNGYAEVDFSYELGYNDQDIPQAAAQTKEIEFAADTRWDDDGALWDTLFWDGQTLQPTSGLTITGEAENISFILRKNSDYFAPVRHTGVHYRYLLRRPIR